MIISGVVAITLSPIMSAYVSPKGGEEGWLTAKVNGIFERVQHQICQGTGAGFPLAGADIPGGSGGISLLVIPFYLFSAKELAPIEDQSSINVVVQAPPESSLSYNVGEMQQVVERSAAGRRRHPYVANRTNQRRFWRA